MKVEIKERRLPTGNRSLYLEYYETGFRKKEYLGIFLVPDDSARARRLNEQTYNRAREIQAQCILNPPNFESKKKAQVEDVRAKTMTWLGWCDEYRNPHQIKSGGGKLADFTLVLFEETVKAIFNKAVRDSLITFNPIQDLAKEERFHIPDKHREYLTAEELKRFLAVEAQTQAERTVQKVFGCSCMTVLRLGDMQRLRWNDIKDTGEVLMVSIVQHKTKRPVTVPLNELAISLLPPRPEDGEDGIIFPLVKKPDNVAKYSEF